MRRLGNLVMLVAFTLGSAASATAANDFYRVTTETGEGGGLGARVRAILKSAPQWFAGRTTKVRIEKHYVDVFLEGASVQSCGGNCSATVTRKGNKGTSRNQT